MLYINGMGDIVLIFHYSNYTLKQKNSIIMLYCCVIKKDKNLYYICCIVCVTEKDKYGLLDML